MTVGNPAVNPLRVAPHRGRVELPEPWRGLLQRLADLAVEAGGVIDVAESVIGRQFRIREQRDRAHWRGRCGRTEDWYGIGEVGGRYQGAGCSAGRSGRAGGRRVLGGDQTSRIL